MARSFGRLGTACLAVYLLLQGLLQASSLSFPGMLLGVLAILAGALLLAGR
ncbi:MAG TPA: hypothetical protein VGV61_10115 [Thermoanaerobaculia bacterium]|jgi:hypothetical protein|nr:hypothetical protein [Thermoanaerobaculia bacterium]